MKNPSDRTTTMNMAELNSSLTNDPRKGTWNQSTATIAKPIDLYIGGISLHDCLRVANENICGVVIRGIHQRLNQDGTSIVQPVGKVPGNHDRHLRVTIVERSRKFRITVGDVYDLEI